MLLFVLLFETRFLPCPEGSQKVDVALHPVYSNNGLDNVCLLVRKTYHLKPAYAR